MFLFFWVFFFHCRVVFASPKPGISLWISAPYSCLLEGLAILFIYSFLYHYSITYLFSNLYFLVKNTIFF